MTRCTMLVLPAFLLGLAACSASDSTAPNTTGGGNDTTPKPKSGAACLQNLVGPAPTAAAAVHGSSVDLPVLGTGPVADRYTAEVAERAGYAYTSTWYRRGTANVVGNAVKVWDVRGAAPVLVDSLLVPGATTTGDVEIADDGSILVVPSELGGDNGLSVFSLADPAHPRLLANFSSADTHPGVHTVKLARIGNGLFAFLAIDPTPQQLVVLDLTDPSNPKQLLARPMGDPFIHDTNIRSGILFTALWNDGLTAWDLGGCGQGGTPANPVSLVSYKTVAVDGANPSVHNIWWLHSADGSRRYLLVGEEQPIGQIGVSSGGDIHVVDISNPVSPKEVAFFHVPNAGTHNFSVDEAHGVLYAAYYNAGVRAIDVRGDLSACTGAAKTSDGRCDLAAEGRELGHGLTGTPNLYVWGVVYDAGKLYVSGMVHGLYVLDASALAH